MHSDDHVGHKFTTEVFDRRDSFGFNIAYFSFLGGNIHVPVHPAYGVYISQLVRIDKIFVVVIT